MHNQGLRKKSLIKSISALYRYSQSYISKRVSPYNIGQGQWHFLTQVLFNEDGITQEELSERLFIDKANTARAVKKLEQEGYIERREDPEDKRKKRVYVTQKSRDFENEFHQVFKDFNNILAKGFTAEERETARELLYRMLDNIIQYKEENTGIKEKTAK
jgi:DNA-binding MarR family transcriptional regulator